MAGRARNVSPAASNHPCWRSAANYFRPRALPMVVVLPEPLTPTTRITKGAPPQHRSRAASQTGDSTFLDLRSRPTAFTLVGRDRLVVATRRRPPRQWRAATWVPKIGAPAAPPSMSSSHGANRACALVTRSATAEPSELEGSAFSPLESAAANQLNLGLSSVLVAHGRAVLAVSPCKRKT